MRSPKKIVDMSKEFSTDKILGLLFTPKAAVLIRLVLSALRVNSVKNERLELSLIRAMWGGEKDPELKHSLGLALTQNYSFDGFATRHNVDHLK